MRVVEGVKVSAASVESTMFSIFSLNPLAVLEFCCTFAPDTGSLELSRASSECVLRASNELFFTTAGSYFVPVFCLSVVAPAG